MLICSFIYFFATFSFFSNITQKVRFVWIFFFLPEVGARPSVELSEVYSDPDNDSGVYPALLCDRAGLFILRHVSTSTKLT